MAEGNGGAQADYPSAGYAWWVVIVLLTTYTLSYVDRMILSLLIKPIRAELGITDTQISLLIGIAFAFFYLLMTVPFGQLADRSNRRNLILLGVTIWSLATAGCGLAPSFAILVLARFGVGMGQAVMSPCAFSIVADVFPRAKLASAASVFAMGVPIGTAIALVCGGMILKAASEGPVSLPLVGELEPWRVVMLSLLLPGVAVVALLFSIAEPVRRDVRGTDKTSYRELFAFINSPAGGGAWPVMIGMALFFVATQGALPWIPTFFERTYGTPIKDTSFMIGALTAACGAVALFTGGFLADTTLKRGRRDGHVLVMLTGGVVVIPALIGMALAPTAQLAYVALGFLIFFMFVPIGVGAAAMQLITPNRLRGQMSALNMLFSGGSSLAIGPSVVALCTDYIFHDDMALRYSLVLATAVVGPMAVISFLIAKRPFARTVEALMKT